MARLREIHKALRAQREDRHRADALLNGADTDATTPSDCGEDTGMCTCRTAHVTTPPEEGANRGES